MEFKFNLRDVFDGADVVEVGNTLIPPGFSGDKRALWDTQSKVSQIVNAMGEASAAAQGLSKPITTSDRLRNSEHKLYLLIDDSGNNGRGSVTGMLKTGEKGLYVFDRDGRHYQVSPHCVLDFYVHESKQRSGLGKKLFEYMLQRENVEPVKMAIDRPSEKLLGFLRKHYDLTEPVNQMNNYVVFDGFFPRPSETASAGDSDPSQQLRPSRKESANGLQQQQYPSSPYGSGGDPAATVAVAAPKADRPHSLELSETRAEAAPPDDAAVEDPSDDVKLDDDLLEIGDGLGVAEAAPRSATPAAGVRTPIDVDVTSGKNTPGLTDQGYFDLKFYHNKLW